MIAINDVPFSVDEIKAKFPTCPLDKIRKASEFQINEILKGYDLGSKRKRDFPGEAFPSVFTVESKDGKPMEIRFFKTKNNIKDKNGNFNVVYSPRKSKFSGDIEYAETVDYGVWLWLRPECRQSPFRDMGKVNWSYEFVDRQEKSVSDLKKGDTMLEALQHAKSLVGSDLILFAKGLGIIGVDAMEEIDIQAQMSNIAIANPSDYLKKTGKYSTQFDGRIVDAVDRGLFILKESFGISKWEWGMGAKKGQLICEVSNQSITPTEFLMNHIKNGNINDYHADIINIREQLEANERAEAFLTKIANEKKGQQEVVTEQEEEEINPVVKLDLPTNFKEAVAYLTARDGKVPSNVNASKFLKELQGEEV